MAGSVAAAAVLPAPAAPCSMHVIRGFFSLRLSCWTNMRQVAITCECPSLISDMP